MTDLSQVRWHAPGRVNLIGEHTDYNDGFVLPFALQLGVTATVRLRDDDVLTISSSTHPDRDVRLQLDELKPEGQPGWAAYVEGVVWELDRRGRTTHGADVHLDADLPAGAGLSSSAAVTCAVAGALGELLGAGLEEQDVIDVAHAAESDYVGVPVGVLDQNAIVRSRAGRALFLDTRSMAFRQVPLELAAHGTTMLVIDTRAPHELADGEYARRRDECRRAAREARVDSLRDLETADRDSVLARLPDDVLRRRVRHVLTENARVLETVQLLERGADTRAIGPLLTASHASLRDDYEVSAPGLDLAVDTALRSGAHGARMTGGGFGGSAIALVDVAAAATVRDAVLRAFADAAMPEPTVFAVEAADGAHRV